MMPWGHLLVGYLVYSFGRRLWSHRAPVDGPVLALAFATQFPDLLDKPLNWWFGILDGRGIGHSFLTMVPFCVAVYLLARRYDRSPLGAAFGVGILTHLPTDALRALWAGTIPEQAPYLLWPLLSAPTYPKDSLADHLLHIDRTAQGIIRAAVQADSTMDVVGLLLHVSIRLGPILVLFLVWRHDGYPGLRVQ